MSNVYLKNLSKIEFVVTSSCTGRCKHCSQGEHDALSETISGQVAADAVRKIASAYDIRTVMTFGGEPLLFPETVYAIINAAREMHVERRQVITNGYFSKNYNVIRKVAEGLSLCGVNDLLLSVDAFHQETIPIGIVKQFASEVKACGIPMRLQPAWLVSSVHDNPYNRKTLEILDDFKELDIMVGDGNVIFPEGNALRYLPEYFSETTVENPYVENPRDVRCVSFSPCGDVLCGNVYKQDIMSIIEDYRP